MSNELWAVHAQGPDDIYPAYDRADAERHAAELNAIQTPPGISVGAVVIPSPMSPLEHWKELAEQPSAIALSIEAAEEVHGSLRAAAKALDVDHGYLSRLKNGDKSNPSDELLAKLGLERLVIYRTAAHDKQSGEVKP